MSTITKTFTICDIDFEVEFGGTPYRPAYTSGAPENCYPAEGGECEVISVCIEGWDVTEVLSEFTMKLIEKACDDYISSGELEQDAAAAEADYLYEMRRDEAMFA